MDDERRRPGWRGSVARTWARHPRWGMALKAAVAASLAWAVAQLVPGSAGDYPYYAPLGAVVATSTTLAGSAREGLQTVAAIAAGAAVALGVDALSYPNVLTIALVVAAGMAVGGWRVLGAAGSWAPTAALFVLVIGNADPLGYVAGYAGLTLLGALIGLLVTAAFPPLPLAPAQAELERLRRTLAGQLDDLVDGLRQDAPPDEAGWRARMRAIDPVLGDMREAVGQAESARRGNRRARRYAPAVDRQYREARALESVAFLVQDTAELLREHETAAAGWADVALGPRLRPPTTTAIAAVADLLRTRDDPDAARTAADAVEDLAGSVRAEQGRTGHDLFVAGSLVTTLRRSLTALTGRDAPAAES
ncbi:FUSC family protein [Klenkia taihuensis]|uniref:Aromatic acid exporter family member 1 n=1 Tax=Klenkia taihuensis TaxID=1225127 RepID=A0A1I1SG96_9ACTN|nr:hypothetical protein [Klenkia taihuensis]GHE13433.1 hypothetical protein GCM10011381_35680 [Klenkia taihuensis]SFD45499.1 hypothetical protein SAMN05661030_3401 [Klenkia taihuensis]